MNSNENGADNTYDWAARGACRSTDPDSLFVQGAAQNRAKTVCMSCPVRTECLADALDNRIEFGVWGGMTERERRALLRRRPNVVSWRRLLETARAEHLRVVTIAAERSAAAVAPAPSDSPGRRAG
jgi:WhiB family transcriptional regulator, redox-sensing transcriptional regulator